MSDGAAAVLDVKDLRAVFGTGQGTTRAVNPVSSYPRPVKPTTAADGSIRARVVSLLEHSCEPFALTGLFISRDLSTTRHIADRAAVTCCGEIGNSDRATSPAAHRFIPLM